MPDTARLLDHFYLTLGGGLNDELMNDQLEVIVESSLQLPDMATVIVHDTKLKWIDDHALDPGTPLKISAKAEPGTRPLFDGEIVELEPDFGAGSQRMIIRALDKMHRLGRGTAVRTFLNMTDGDIVKKVVADVGLSASVDPTPTVHEYVLQANETNLAFLRRRAAALGFVLYMNDGALQCKAPKADAEEVELKWGDTLLEFHPRMTTVDQVAEHVVRGWDFMERRELKGLVKEGDGAPAIGEARTGGAMSTQAFNLPAQRLTADRAVRSQADADRLAKALADHGATSFVEVEGTAKGDPRIVAGAKVKLANIGTRFSGSYVVTNARHIYDRAQQGYTTEFTVSGHHPISLLATINGDRGFWLGDRVVIGVVTNNDDPQDLGRVKVKFPWLSPDQESAWARVVATGAGNERGIQFIPEIQDEVLVAFELGDVNQPYILGGLWNGQDKLARAQSQVIKGSKVEQRVIRSRTGHTITFDDADGAGGITIEDRKGNVLRLQSQDDKLVIKTQGNVEIETQADASIRASGSLVIEAGRDMELKASTGISIEGGVKVDVKGGIINLN